MNARALGVAAAVLALSACNMRTVRRDAFGPKKTYAVVSIHAHHKIQPHGNTQGMGSLTGLVKSAKKDAGRTADVAEALEEGAGIVLRALRGSRHYQLLAEERVLRSAVYAKAAGDDPDGTFLKFKAAKGYKYFAPRSKQKLAQLARELKVDGVIVAQLNYGFLFSGVSAAGLVAGGKHRGSLMLTVVAYDRDGAPVWTDVIQAKSEKTIGTAAANVADFPKLRPLLTEATSSGSRDLVAQLDRSVGKP
jgi:hypothetical protein